MSLLDYATPPSRSAKSTQLWIAYFVEGCSSISAQMLMVAIYFYTRQFLHWTLQQNFMLAASQGAVYVCGALLSSRATKHLGHRGLLLALHAVLASIVVSIYHCTDHHPVAFVAMLITYTFFSALGWPPLESLISAGCDPHTLSRRIGIYNLVWSGTGALTVAVAGTLLAHWQSGIFIVAISMHLVGLLFVALGLKGAVAEAAADAPLAHAEPEPDLLHSRKLALWLSRIVLPAEYVVIYGIVAMMPLLSIMQYLSPSQRTLLASVWMVVRWFTFLTLGLITWWHTRPRLLLVASFAMLVAFLGIAFRPGDFTSCTLSTDLIAIICAQIVLGIALGLIYAASLYFGMVLSEGATEHGGYHEALIGLGSVLGPGSGAIAQQIYPRSVPAGATAVAIVIAASVLVATAVSVRLRRNGRRIEER